MNQHTLRDGRAVCQIAGKTCMLPSCRGRDACCFKLERGGVADLLVAVEREDKLALRRRLLGGDNVTNGVDGRDGGLLPFGAMHGATKTFSRFRETERLITRGLVSLVAISSSASIADADIVFLSIPCSSSCSAWHCPRVLSVLSSASA